MAHQVSYRHDYTKSLDENVTREMGRAVNNQPDFVARLKAGTLPRAAYPDRLALVTHCPDCGEICFALLFGGQRYLVHASVDRWTVHQCPDPIEDCKNDE